MGVPVVVAGEYDGCTWLTEGDELGMVTTGRDHLTMGRDMLAILNGREIPLTRACERVRTVSDPNRVLQAYGTYEEAGMMTG